ncbi:cytochrome p450 monooxygenase [Aspergillus crustosus]
MDNIAPLLESSIWNTSTSAFVSGIILHQTIFRHGEWHRYAREIIVAYVTATAALIFLPAYFERALHISPLTPSLALRLILSHLAGLYSSITLYRAFFHPLHNFPGPFPARLATFYKIYLSRKYRLFEETYKLHQQYGDVVRLGPSELSIADPAAVKKIHWPQATPGKGPWYEQGYPRVSLLTSRDRNEHARLRKIWDRGFNAKALRDYSPRIREHTLRLQDVLEKNLNKPLNITQWLNYYSFDVMGDLAFGKSFDMLLGGKDHYFLSVLHFNMRLLAIVGPPAWIAPIFTRTPVLNAEANRFWKFIGEQVTKRIENPPPLPDIFHWILQGYGDTINTKPGRMNLEAEAELIIVAGSDTTATTLTNSIFELLTHPQHITTLREEFSEKIGKSLTEITPEELGKLPHLNAVVSETLRLHPPVPSGVQRKTGEGGIMFGDGVGETRIPGGTIIQVPFYTLFRDKRCFNDPHSFIPERWTTQPELNPDASVFIPFSNGAYSCVGKQLGLMEIRWVLTMLITQYDISFAPGYDIGRFEAGAVDGFTLNCAPLEVRIERRDVG